MSDPERTMCPHCATEGTEVTTTVSDHYYCVNGDCPVNQFVAGTADRLLPAAHAAAKILGGEADELEARDDYEQDEHLQDVAQGLRLRQMNLRESLEALGYLTSEDARYENPPEYHGIEEPPREVD